MSAAAIHPRDALFDPDEAAVPSLPVCDHYSGVEARMKKSLELQAELGPVFDVTLDGEDGAPVGGEIEHAHLIAELVMGAGNRFGRVGARVQAVDHRRFDDVVDVLVTRAGAKLAYLMVPKPRGLADFERAAAAIDHATRRAGLARSIPLHALVETHGALREVQALAAHPRIESLSFGLMDFVSAHRGAIPQSAMGVMGQFEHPLVVRAKLEIAAACHGHAKVPSHCVVTEFKHASALQQAAERACRQFGYTRMWSIHPAQVRTIVEAFSPTTAEVDLAIEILSDAQAAGWAPIRHHDTLHDRASYRYFWQLLERAHRTSMTGGAQLPAQVRQAWFGDGPAAPKW
jgi:citrate lyase subunit beta / citryl-CoA lyase